MKEKCRRRREHKEEEEEEVEEGERGWGVVGVAESMAVTMATSSHTDESSPLKKSLDRVVPHLLRGGRIRRRRRRRVVHPEPDEDHPDPLSSVSICVDALGAPDCVQSHMKLPGNTSSSC